MDKFIRIFRRNLIRQVHLRPQSFFGLPPQGVVTASVFHKNSLRPRIVVVPASEMFLRTPPLFLSGRNKVRSVHGQTVRHSKALIYNIMGESFTIMVFRPGKEDFVLVQRKLVLLENTRKVSVSLLLVEVAPTQDHRIIL